jgi:hypothetical protein
LAERIATVTFRKVPVIALLVGIDHTVTAMGGNPLRHRRERDAGEA